MVHKTGEFLGNRIPGAVTNSYDNKVLQLKSVEQIIIPPEKREDKIKQTKTSIIKMEHYKTSKL